MVMSQAENPSSTIPTTRRALLMGLAAAATPMAPALANALSDSAPGEVDPIFAVIAEHADATESYVRACDISMELVDGTPDWKTADAVTSAAHERWHAAWLAVVTSQPTTVQGVAALLAHVGRSEFLGEQEKREGLPEIETVLSSWINDTDPEHEYAIAAKAFESRLGETLRNIVARGQA
jgi:hypothetical protein